MTFKIRPRRHLRAVVALLLLVTGLSLGVSLATHEFAAADGPAEGAIDRTMAVTIDGAGPGQVVAYGPGGGVEYRNRSLWIYHDVDPVGNGTSVEFVASEVVNRSQVPQDGGCDDRKCMRNVVRRVDLANGAARTVYVNYDPLGGSRQYHDVDRVNESVLLVADIGFPDGVYMVDTDSGEVIWRWNVSEAYSEDSGGVYPSDWTHLNDVEYLDDGRVMVNLRNQDQVIFLRPGEGVIENWTLGSDDDHTTLYEPHNPDYIPRAAGGPAVLVADSENNRIVEYQRRNGSWERSWVWADRRLQWPRDADRMPNGDTMVVDSHGSRLLRVSPNGSVVWSHPFPDGGYDAEMLGTGDESTGPSAARAGLTSRTPRPGSNLVYAVVSLVPPLVLHGLLFVLPIWTTAVDTMLALLTGTAVLIVLATEAVVRVRAYRR